MRHLSATLAGAVVVAAMLPVASGGATTASAGTLSLQAVLARQSRSASCPPGAPASFECFAHEDGGAVRGLGTVTASYIYVVDTAPAGCPSGSFKLRASSARLVVAGKGEIRLGFNDQEGCYVPGGAPNVTQSFTITGGSAIYAGASGGGTVVHDIRFGPVGPGMDTWMGTLVVPGLDFDVTPPTLSGVVNKTVRARKGVKRVRVTYRVTARDDVDGVRPVSCRPRAGSLFKVGRTTVTCSATDTSANTATARFKVTVRRR
jgi:hypothetical protein